MQPSRNPFGSWKVLQDANFTYLCYDSLRRNNKIVSSPKAGAAGSKRLYTVLGYENVIFTTTTTYHYNNGMLLSETTGDETLRYYYDSTGKVVSFSYKKGEEKEKGYYYARNAQGDIIAVYRSEDSKLMGTYEYDLWGRIISVTEGEEGVDTDNILTKNPFRYRSYYYDNETGFYNLNARYYDPQIRRFISADSMSVLMVATVSLECKNLFAYSENNPITGKDSSGGIIESAFDIVTLAGSIVDVCCHPTDPWAWAGLVGDAVDLIPVVTGVGEGIKGLRVAAKAAEVADNAHDAGKAAEAVSETAQVVSKTSKTPKVHGNSLTSTKPQHGYEIYNTQTGDVVKTGISGQKLNVNGTSPRANSQVNKLNKTYGPGTYDARVVITNIPNRMAALQWEKDNAFRLWNEKNSMSIHYRPTPWR